MGVISKGGIRGEKKGPVVLASTVINNRKRADSKIKSRKDGALLAQLRAGHCLHLSHYIAIDNIGDKIIGDNS